MPYTATTLASQKKYPANMPTVADSKNATPLIELLRKTVSKTPDKQAVDFLGRAFTYRDLYKQVQKTAGLLYSIGVRKGDVVALVLPNCPQHFILFYAITSLGAIVAEHNPLAPPAQLRSQLDNHKAHVVIAWENVVKDLMPDGKIHDRTILAVDITKAIPKRSQFLLNLPIKQARQQRAQLRAVVPPGVQIFDRLLAGARRLPTETYPHIDPEDTAVLLHTGGTTGIPKAVEISHRNLYMNAYQCHIWCAPGLQADVTVGAALPFFHAFGITLSLVYSVMLGAIQVMLPKFDPDMMLAAHRRHPINFFVGVPPMFDRIEKRARQRKIDLSDIHLAISGAMSLSPEIAERWEQATGHILIEGYGMTEASPVICGNPATAERRPGTLGLPLPGTDLKIVNPDDHSKEVKAGAIGELLVRGPQVFKRYYNAPEETKATMRGDWLCTGDLVRQKDGFIVIADRRKEIIINGGFNIYPSEVETVVRDMPGIMDVAVVGMQDGASGESVVAALVLEPGAQIDLEQVRKWSSNKLPRYALPKRIAVVDDLPRSQIGKVLRRVVKENIESLQATTAQAADVIMQKAAPVAETVSKSISEVAASVQRMVWNDGKNKQDKPPAAPMPTPPKIPDKNK